MIQVWSLGLRAPTSSRRKTTPDEAMRTLSSSTAVNRKPALVGFALHSRSSVRGVAQQDDTAGASTKGGFLDLRWRLVSIPVGLAALAGRIEDFGPIAHLVTVRSGERPHVVAVKVRWDDRRLVVAAGRTTSANVDQRPDVTVLWAAPPGGAYCLIVDGTARRLSGADGPGLAIEPTAAVLHRTPEGDPSEPSCITVLPRPGKG